MLINIFKTSRHGGCVLFSSNGNSPIPTQCVRNANTYLEWAIKKRKINPKTKTKQKTKKNDVHYKGMPIPTWNVQSTNKQKQMKNKQTKLMMFITYVKCNKAAFLR